VLPIVRVVASPADSTPHAFVIMPFDREFQPIYEQLIRPALEDAGYDIIRADSFLDQQNILQTIVREIASADLVIADVTTINANVFYELGLAHGLRRPTVLIAQSLDEIPFDLRSYRVVVYSTQFDQVSLLKDSLNDIARRHLHGEIQFGSPVIDFLPGEGAPRPLVDRGGAAAEAEPIAADEEEPLGFLDALVEAGEAGEQLERFFNTLSAEQDRLTESIQRQTQELQEAAASGDPGAARRMLNIAHNTAQDLTGYGDRLESLLPDFEGNVAKLVDRFEVAVRSTHIESADEIATALEGRRVIEELLQTTRGNLTAVGELRENMRQAGGGASRELMKAGRRIASLLDRYVTSLEQFEAFAVRTIAVYDAQINEAEQATNSNGKTENRS
jgi:hypothetical protein